MLVEPVSKGRGRVLVVDDDAEFGAMLEELLGLLAEEVHVVSTAEEALALHRRAPVDVLVTDVLLEGMSGLELVRALRQSRLGAVVPTPATIVLTGSASTDAGTTALELGAAACLTKPCDPKRLMELVEELIADPAA